MDYTLLKYLHVICVVLSYFGFLGRGILMIQESPALHARWAKIAPHAVDTGLLASAVALAAVLEQYPLVHAWITAKVIALLPYIGLGMVALKYGRTRRVRIAAWVAAQLVFFYIVAVARTRNPMILS